MAAPRMSGVRSAIRGAGRHRRAKASHLALAAAALVAAAGSLAYVGLSGRSASASEPPLTTTSFHVNHFNVGAAHSPQLLRQLAGPTTSGTMTPATSSSTAVQGVDVASFQESSAINWTEVAGAGIKFAGIKATEGAYYHNPYALKDLAAAKAAGLSVVAYVFAIPNGDGASASPTAQADYAINYLKSGPAGVPPIMLDIEYDPYKGSDGTNDCYGLSPSAMGTWITDFANEVQAKTGRQPVIYTTTNWWSECVGKALSLGSSPLWIAGPTSSLPTGWSNFAYQQYSSSGTVSGIADPGNTDLDQLNPNLLTLLNPGDQQHVADGSQVTLQLHASQTATYSPVSLPAGFTISSTGQITGPAPTSPGTSTLEVSATSGSASQSVTFAWYWTGTLSVTSPGSLSTIGGSPVDRQIQVTDSPAEPPVTFSAPTLSSTHRLPPGLSISSSGKITGWADKPGTYTVTVYAADNLEAASSVTFTWTVTVAPDIGPTGFVRLDLGGKCLDDPNASSTTGTIADIRTCHSDTAQRWTYAQDDSLRIQGLCLQSPSTEGSKVQLELCTGQANQQWQLVYARSVRSAANGADLALYNPGSGLCLNDPGNSTTNGTQQTVWLCNGSHGQEWQLPGGPVQLGIAGSCLDNYQNLTTNGNKVDVNTCNGGTSQVWTAHTDGTVRTDGKCLNLRDGRTASGTLVNLYSCNGSSAQQWQLIANGGAVLLQNPHSGLCLADPSDRTANGTQLQIRPCTKSDPGKNWRVS